MPRSAPYGARSDFLTERWRDSGLPPRGRPVLRSVQHLAAASLGLASQWLSDFGSPWLEGMTRNLLQIPEHYHIYEAMAVGWPSYYPKPRYIKPMEEFVHRGKYDPGKSRTQEEICEYIDAHMRPETKQKS